MATNINSRTQKPTLTSLHIIFLSLFILTLPALLLLHSPPTSIFNCSTSTTTPASAATSPWSGDLRQAEFSWNHLKFSSPRYPPPETLKLAVFSRKWPAVTSAPGGMERHTFTLHTALARRGHKVHVFTSPPPASDVTTVSGRLPDSGTPEIHFLDGEPGKWRCHDAWSLFEKENLREEPFDLVHSESVSLPHSLARNVPNLAVSWHGIALEGLQSAIYQDSLRGPGESMASSLNRSLSEGPYKILKEIKFFKSYAHHVAISDSSGEILRDVYQIPNHRVHVILNGVDEREFGPDEGIGKAFRAEIGVPENASLVMGVAGRLVRDKGHPLLHEALPKLMLNHTNLYLIVAGSGPWARRYTNLGPRVLTLGALPPAKLKAFYNSIDVFVNPTLRPQGLDLTLMEAMQCGKPILATRLPSIKGSIVVSDEFGYTFSPNVDSLGEVLERVVGEGPGRLAERGKACREYAFSMFTARKMAMAYERLFLCIKNETYCKYPLHFDNTL